MQLQEVRLTQIETSTKKRPPVEGILIGTPEPGREIVICYETEVKDVRKTLTISEIKHVEQHGNFRVLTTLNSKYKLEILNDVPHLWSERRNNP